MKPPLDDSAMGGLLGYTVAKADVALRRAFAPIALALDIRASDYSALVIIGSNADVSPGALGRTLDVSAPNLAVMLDRLEMRGLIARVRRADDKRGFQIKLTAEGKSVVKRGRLLEPQADLPVTKRLSAAERALLLELLQKLVK